ncbi:MAG: DUF389 domain-containing protein [Paludibacteraceae bacterium]|nr:DUF389 domain-containing protein [Paludibacteraceae bacterium]
MEEQPKKTFREKVGIVWHDVRLYLKALVDIDVDCDAQATIDNISRSVEFRGVNVWILAFAIVIASVGLNVNSTAVIIGAMLISPLMSPIMGIGLAIGISDNNLLRKSLRNLVIMVLISLLASTTYFLLTPLSDAQSELLARTKPTVFDVLIALFGGLAGIVATSRKQEKVTVVSGVAIATALMPPLCTAGYGLGTGQWIYFFGAFYLFFINSFFIALATFVMVRYLKFPRKHFVDAQHERKVRRSILVFSLIIIIPSVFIGINVIRETSFNSQAIKYVSEMEHSAVLENVQIINVKRQYSAKEQSITLSLVGTPLTPEQVEYLQKRLDDFGLEKAKLVIRQTGGNTLDIDAQSEMIQQILERKEVQLAERDSTILRLREQIERLENKSTITPEQLVREVKVLFPSVESMTFSIADEIDVKTAKKQQIPVVNVAWNESAQATEKQQFELWMKARLDAPQVKIVVEGR